MFSTPSSRKAMTTATAGVAQPVAVHSSTGENTTYSIRKREVWLRGKRQGEKEGEGQGEGGGRLVR